MQRKTYVFLSVNKSKYVTRVPKHAPPLFQLRGLSLLPNFQQKKGGLDKILIFREGLLGKSGGDIFQGGGGKLKSEIFNDKKSL